MNGKKGFTLIELMIVVAIMGVISAVAIPQYLDYVAASKRRATLTNYEIAVRAVKGEFCRVAAGNTSLTQARMVLELNGVPGVSVLNFNPYTLSETDTAFVENTPTKDGEVGLEFVGYSGGAIDSPQTGDSVVVSVWYVNEAGSSAQKDGPGATNSRTIVLTYE